MELKAAGTVEVTYAVYNSPQALSFAAAEHFVSQAEAAVVARGVARIAISGGHTPKATFALLADQAQPFYGRMPWKQLQIYWVDERCVPPDHEESNYRMTREALLQKVPLDAGQVFRMEGELDPEEAAARYESTIRDQFRLEGAEPPRFDAVELGMGDDGHTASLFPHTDAIHETGRIVIANRVPQKDTWRITLTWPVINQARDVFFLIEGADKSEILSKVLTAPRDVETLPSQLIRPTGGKLLLILDKAAAAHLPSPGPNGIGIIDVGTGR